MFINYKLETLVRYKQLPINGQFHRALADAEMAALLWIKIIEDLKEQFGFENVSFDLMKRIGKMKKDDTFKLLRKEAEILRTQEIDTTGNLFALKMVNDTAKTGLSPNGGNPRILQCEPALPRNRKTGTAPDSTGDGPNFTNSSAEIIDKDR